LETAYFANCPWVRLHPDATAPTSVSALGVVNAVSVSESLLCPLSKEASDELEQHRRQGHMPFNAQCLECNRGRSVFQHRRKKEGSKDVELQADFCFLSQTGEVSLEESERAVKILVITESMSGCLGAIVIGSDNKVVQRQLKEWLDHFGLLSKETSIVIRTDAEISVGELIGRSVGNYNFMVRRAGPQQHRSIGSAERGVREIKESLSVLRSDLNGQGLDIAFSESGLTDCLTYLCLCHNHFGKVHGTDTSPLEMSAGKKLGKPAVSMFGSCVLAELPDSVKELSPNETRNVEGCFIHTGLLRGAVVQAKIRCDGGFEVVRFTARNIRPISPLSWNVELGQDVIVKLEENPNHEYIHDKGLKVEGQRHVKFEDEPEKKEFDELPIGEQRRLKSESMPVRTRSLVEPKVEVARKPGALKLQRQTPLRVESKSNVVEGKPTSIPQGVETEKVSSKKPSGVPTC
jgi:hypothetical protein